MARNLASSTWALFKSLERRAEKLSTVLNALQSGLLVFVWTWRRVRPAA